MRPAPTTCLTTSSRRGLPIRGDAVLAADPALQKQLDAYVEHSKVLATACRLPLLGVDKGFGVRHAPSARSAAETLGACMMGAYMAAS